MANVYKEGFDAGYEVGRDDGVRSCELTQTGMILKMMKLLMKGVILNELNTSSQRYINQIYEVLEEVEKMGV